MLSSPPILDTIYREGKNPGTETSSSCGSQGKGRRKKHARLGMTPSKGYSITTTPTYLAKAFPSACKEYEVSFIEFVEKHFKKKTCAEKKQFLIGACANKRVAYVSKEGKRPASHSEDP
jgi:hypothetical protein